MKGKGFRNIGKKHQGGWIQLVAAAVGIVGTIAGFVGSRKGESSARRQARQEARAERDVTQERLRRLDIEQRAEYGSRIAEYVGSGVVATGTPMEGRASTAAGSVGQVIAEQEREYDFERDITQRVGASKVQQALAGGEAVANRYRYSGYANLASGVSNTLSYLATTDWAKSRGWS